MDLRNIAIIAHVDHGKTTLVDELLKQSGAFRENQAVAERAMDSATTSSASAASPSSPRPPPSSGRARGSTSSTPRPRRFRRRGRAHPVMVDGVVLLVDAAEGPMPQTKFVTSKALALGLRPIVVLNKVDKPDAEPDRALDEVFDLFAALDADDDQLDFPHLYASGRSGWADRAGRPAQGPDALFDLIVNHVPPPRQIAARDEPISACSPPRWRRPLLGRILTGPGRSGALKVGPDGQALSRIGQKIEQFRVSKIQAFRGLGPQEIDEARPATSSRSPACPRPPWPTRSARSRSTSPPRPADRPAHHHRHLRHQRQPAGGPRRQEGAVPRDPRTADERGRGRTSRSGRRHARAARPSRSRAAANCRWAC
jgi:GTP-binding protein